MSEYTHRERVHARESESSSQQQDIDLLYVSLMKDDVSKIRMNHADREQHDKMMRAADMRLLLSFARKEGIEPREPSFEWDDIILDRPRIAGDVYGRIIMEYSMDADDRVREMYEERTTALQGIVRLRYAIKRKYRQKIDRQPGAVGYYDDQSQDIVEFVVPEKEIVLKASQSAVDKLNEERAEQDRRVAEEGARYQAFLTLLSQNKKKMPLVFSLKDFELNKYSPLYNGIKEYIPEDFFKRRSGPEYGFRIRTEKEEKNELFVIEAYTKKNGYTVEVYHIV